MKVLIIGGSLALALALGSGLAYAGDDIRISSHAYDVVLQEPAAIQIERERPVTAGYLGEEIDRKGVHQDMRASSAGLVFNGMHRTMVCSATVDNEQKA